jgi:hypothetical protein
VPSTKRPKPRIRLSPDLPADAVSVHSYSDYRQDPLGSAKLTRLHEELQASGRRIPIWLTEYGWSTWMDDRRRAQALHWTFQWLLDHDYVELAHYHMLHDTEESWECCFGLLLGPPTFVPKQLAYDAFRSAIVDGWIPRSKARPARMHERGVPRHPG